MLQISYRQGIARTANPYGGFMPCDDRAMFSNTLSGHGPVERDLYLQSHSFFWPLMGGRGAELDGGLF